jgi:hypothetical protein
LLLEHLSQAHHYAPYALQLLYPVSHSNYKYPMLAGSAGSMTVSTGTLSNDNAV